MIDDDGKLRQRWNNKRVNAAAENHDFDLTFDEYVQLVENANLKSSNLGFTGDNYVLARYNDSGSYTVGNCRFITHLENMQEQKQYQERKANKQPDYVYVHGTQEQYQQHRTEKKLEKREIFEASANKSYLGTNNSQFGTFWITNGESNKKWSPTKGELPEGFHRGRK